MVGDDPSRMMIPVDLDDDDDDDGRWLKKRYLIWFNAIIAALLLPLLAISNFIPGQEEIDPGQWLIMCFVPTGTFIHLCPLALFIFLHRPIFHQVQVRLGEGGKEKRRSYNHYPNFRHVHTHTQREREREY